MGCQFYRFIFQKFSICWKVFVRSLQLQATSTEVQTLLKVEASRLKAKISTVITKFVVSRCALANFEWVFRSVNHLSGDGVNGNHDATQPSP